MGYITCYNKPIDVIIKERVSCRTYQDKPLDIKDRDALVSFFDFAETSQKAENLRFYLTEHNPVDLKEQKLADYGLFSGLRTFIIGVMDTADLCYVSFGNAMEYVVLKATELGLGTCWMGYFNPLLTGNVKATVNQKIPAICAVGYPAATKAFKERAARLFVGASKRETWEKLFFAGDFSESLNREEAGPYAESFELLRLAPSSGNTQPWRIVKAGPKHVYHFFKTIVNDRYEERRLHDIDMGIAMCHFELGAAKHNLRGQWTKTEHHLAHVPFKTHYVITWVEV